jgi:hypothetical protein
MESPLVVRLWHLTARKDNQMATDVSGKLINIGDEVWCHSLGICKVITTLIPYEVDVLTKNNEEKTISTHLTDITKVRSWKELAKEALDIQNACNLSGLVHTFSSTIRELRCRLEDEGAFSTDALNTHPICILFSDKLYSLASGDNDSIKFWKAFDWAKKVSEE